MKKVILMIAIFSCVLISYAQNTITKNVIVDTPGWKRIAKFSGSAGRGYNEITILTKGGTVAPTVSKISWFKGYSDYGGIHTETLSRVRYWSQARITFDGTDGFLEIKFTKEIPSLTVHLNREVWTGGTIFEGTLPNGGGDVVTGTITNFGRLNVASNKLFVNNGNGHVGIGTATPESNLQIGHSTTEGLITLGGGKSYSSIGSTRSDGGLILGKNIYARYKDGTDNYVGRVGANSSTGFTGIKIGLDGVIDFFGKAGNVTADDIANTNLTSKLRITKGGYIGIGTTTPNAGLEIKHDTGLKIQSKTKGGWFGNIKMADGLTNTNSRDDMLFSTSGGFMFKMDDNKNGISNIEGFNIYDRNNKSVFTVKESNGNIGIGTTTPDAKLAVNGTIHSKEVKVDLVGWPDYVFTNDYQLPTLQEVENHIKQKGHLQNIPSAKEVEKNGIKLGEMNKKLLEKVEELTLYTIQQEKKLEKQEKDIEELKALVKQLLAAKK